MAKKKARKVNRVITGVVNADAVGGTAPDLKALLSKFHRFLSRQGQMHDARTDAALFETASRAVGELVRVRGHAVLRRRAAGEYQPIHVRVPPAVNPVDPGVLELCDWAFDTRRAVFYDLEDTGASFHSTICVLPVVSDPNHHIAFVLWADDDLSTIDVLQSELLGTLARDLGARHGALRQATMHQDLASLFDDILESVPQAVIAVTGDSRIVALNGNAEFMFGIRRIFAMDEPYHAVLPANVAAAFDNLISGSLIRGGEAGDLELELRAPDGVALNIGISLGILRDRQGGSRGYLFLSRDLSLSREVQKLNELDRMKSEFVNTVSHELKTPLTAILGGLEVLGFDADRIPADMREMFDVVNKGAARLQNLIMDLLDVSRLESGKVNLRQELVAPARVVEEAVAAIPNTGRHDIRVEIEPNAPAVVMDRVKIVQCLTNYVSNAVKYSPRGGTVTIRVGNDPERRAVVYSVTDQGLGLSPENQKRVWDKFFRVDTGFTQDIEGTGLGLVIVRRTVELHGGSTGVESELGKGSTFWFRLPLKTSMTRE